MAKIIVLKEKYLQLKTTWEVSINSKINTICYLHGYFMAVNDLFQIKHILINVNESVYLVLIVNKKWSYELNELKLVLLLYDALIWILSK